MTSICFDEDVKQGIRQDVVALDWSGRGFSCEMWVDPPDQVWADFSHDADEVLMTITGQLEIEFNGEVHRLPPGQEILIPAKVLHTVRNTGHTTACWLYGYQQ
jgi:mannose-6-phosphate isomerase-like protein (cupin superfamily)